MGDENDEDGLTESLTMKIVSVLRVAMVPAPRYIEHIVNAF